MNRQTSFKILIITGILITFFYGTAVSEEDTAILSAIMGTVEVSLSGTDTWKEAKEGIALSAGDKIKTGADGMTSVLFRNGSEVALKQNTEFEIDSLRISDDRKDVNYTLKLNLGKLRAVVEELGDGSSFEIKTPTAVAAVRGTIYYLNVREVGEDEIPPDVKERLKTEIFVEEDDVVFMNTISGDVYIVYKNQTSGSYGDGTIKAPVEIPEDEQLEWTEGWDILIAEPYPAVDDTVPGDILNGDEGGGEDTENVRQSDLIIAGLPDEGIDEQHERDVIRQEMHDKLLERDYLHRQVRRILLNNDLRRLDGYIEKISDAQTGKVLTDIHGNRVRVEQYILRPSQTNKVVDILNVNLRAGDDLTTMLWSTEFNKSLDSLATGQLKTLPWDSYLDTQYVEGMPSHIINPAQPDDIYPREMSVEFSHIEDSFKESKKFHVPRSGMQEIYNQRFWVNNFNDNEEFMSYMLPGELGQLPGTYSIQPNMSNANIGGTENNPKGFRYNFKNAAGLSDSIDVSFYVLSDGGERQNNYNSLRIDDIWDALRVNMGDKNIGDNNLEMVFDAAAFQDGPIDLIYVPTGRMNWKPDDHFPDFSLPPEGGE